jgi:hypothetical protein
MRFKNFLLEDKRLGTNADVGLEFQMLVPGTSSGAVANGLENLFSNVQHHLPDKMSKRSPLKWHVQADPTLGEGGLELHSPLLPLNDALRDLTKVCDWMEEHNVTTNDSTSLLVRIYISNIDEKLDPVKLVFFMGDDHAENAFSKHVGEFSEPQIDVITQKLKLNGKLPSSMDDLEKAALRYLTPRGNHGKMAAGFLELRVKGGSDYEKDASDLKKKIFKMVTAVEIACDPAMEKGEYLQKLVSLLTSEPAIKVTTNDMHKLPEALHRLYRHKAEINDAWKLFEKDQVHGDARRALLSLINMSLKTVKSLKTSLTLQEKVLFKKLARQVSLQSHDVDTYYGNDHIARLNFKTIIGI